MLVSEGMESEPSSRGAQVTKNKIIEKTLREIVPRIEEREELYSVSAEPRERLPDTERRDLRGLPAPERHLLRHVSPLDGVNECYRDFAPTTNRLPSRCFMRCLTNDHGVVTTNSGGTGVTAEMRFANSHDHIRAEGPQSGAIVALWMLCSPSDADSPSAPSTFIPACLTARRSKPGRSGCIR
jgi:hypothetical protein